MSEKPKNLNIAIIPIDNRPVCYELIQETLAVHKNINCILPDKNLLGSINSKAKIDEILNWVLNLQDIDYIIISLDTIAYGGLISSRKVQEPFQKIKENIDKLFEIIKKKNIKIFAFSSILRISNNNINEEEKEYWDIWGEKIYKYSYLYSQGNKKNLPEIPKEILDDYLTTRKRNFEINKYYLKLKNLGIIDYLVYSKDDTGEFGFNIDEANELKDLDAVVKTGADELPLTLIARALVDFYNESLSFNIIYSNKNAKNIISRYEDLTIKQSVKSQIDTIKCTEGKGINLFLNCPSKIQDDLALNIFKDSKKQIILPESIDIIADIACANGCDKNFAETILANHYNLLGFAGWNTTSNSIGSALFIGIVSYFAKKQNAFNHAQHKKVIQKRFLDDFIYQSIARREIRKFKNEQCLSTLNELMTKYSKIYLPNLNLKNATFYFPCQRTFEIGIDLG